MQVKSQKDLATGLVFLIAGLAYGVASGRYRLGRAMEMGPGYFPLLLAVLLAVIGALVATLSLIGEPRPGDRLERFRLRPVACVLAAMAVFAALLAGVPALGLPSFGLLAALVGLVLVVGMATPKPNLTELSITAGALGVMCYVIFSLLLRIPAPFWPGFL